MLPLPFRAEVAVMTQAGPTGTAAALADVGPPDKEGLGYAALLRRPGAFRFCLAGMVGRFPMSMFGLGTVLLVSARTGRYGLAGLVAGAGSIGYAIASPQIARLADRLGQRRVLRPLAVVFGLASITFVTSAEAGAPAWALVITGTVAGASMPSLGSMVRARWSALLTGQPAGLNAAFALESVLDEMIFVIGPAAVTLLAALVPAAGVLLAMVLSVTGTLVFAAQRRTEPPAHSALVEARRRTERQRFRVRSLSIRRPRAAARLLPTRGLAVMAPLYLLVGAMFASIDLSTVDFAQRQGHRPLAGLVLGTYALGSAVGGLWYGSRTWRATLARRFTLTLSLTVAGVATFWAQPNLLTLDAGMLVAGLVISPTLIAGYGLIERQAPLARRTEAMTWLSSAISVGVAVGAATCGHIVDALGPRYGYGFAATCGVAAVTVCILGFRRFRCDA